MRAGSDRVVNPGSLGQPKNGSPRACYAVWDGGTLRLQSFTCGVEETVAKIRSLPVPERVQEDLAAVLTTGLVR